MEVVLRVTKRMRFIENIPAFVLEPPLFKCFFNYHYFCLRSSTRWCQARSMHSFFKLPAWKPEIKDALPLQRSKMTSSFVRACTVTSLKIVYTTSTFSAVISLRSQCWTDENWSSHRQASNSLHFLYRACTRITAFFFSSLTKFV